MSVKALESLKKAILEYNGEAAASLARKAIQGKLDPTKAIDALTEAIREVGDGFGKGSSGSLTLSGQHPLRKRLCPF